MPSFKQRHLWLIKAARLSWLSIVFAVALYVCNRFFPADNVAKSWWWTLILPNAMIAFVFHRESNRAKAEHDLIMDALTERLGEGTLTEPDRRLALRYYDELRPRLHDAAVHGGSFRSGEALHLVLCAGPTELQAVLPKLRVAPSDVPELTSDQEALLARIAAENARCRQVIIQWLFLSGGESAIERLLRDGVYKPAEDEITNHVLGILELLPDLPSGKYSQVVGFLKWRKPHLKGKTALVSKLQDRLTKCDDRDFQDTVAVIGGINCDRGRAALNECLQEIPKKQKQRRDCIDSEIAALLSAPANC